MAIKATGLCGSDIHYYSHGRNGDIIMKEPMCLGHESAGVVTEVGKDVSNLKVGDKVALEVGMPCNACELCKSGRYNICKGMKFAASARNFPHTQGTLQERKNHPAEWAHKLPEDMSLEQGALLEPLSVAMHALDRATLSDERQESVLILGAGAVGALVGAALRLKFPRTNVVIADVDQSRVEFAVTNHFANAGFVVPMKRGKDTEEQLAIAQELADLSRQTLAKSFEHSAGFDKSDGFDAVFECTGVQSCLQSAIYATKSGGRVMLIGMGTPIQTLPISAAALREVDLRGVFRYHHTYPRCIEMVVQATRAIEGGKPLPDIRKLITHRVHGMGEIPKAFKAASKPVDPEGNKVLKVVINL